MHSDSRFFHTGHRSLEIFGRLMSKERRPYSELLLASYYTTQVLLLGDMVREKKRMHAGCSLRTDKLEMTSSLA